MSAWIPCAERLPETAERVLAFREPKAILPALGGGHLRGYPVIARCEWARDGTREWAYTWGDTTKTGIA